VPVQCDEYRRGGHQLSPGASERVRAIAEYGELGYRPPGVQGTSDTLHGGQPGADSRNRQQQYGKDKSYCTRWNVHAFNVQIQESKFTYTTTAAAAATTRYAAIATAAAATAGAPTSVDATRHTSIGKHGIDTTCIGDNYDIGGGTSNDDPTGNNYDDDGKAARNQYDDMNDGAWKFKSKWCD
ncbi:hypothetical protein PR001_g19721, partial [Phytophthora rubi]